MVGIHYVEPYVPVQNLRHERIERTPARGNRVQDFRAVSLAFDRMLNRLDLPANAADPIEHLLLVSQYVSQNLSPDIRFG